MHVCRRAPASSSRSLIGRTRTTTLRLSSEDTSGSRKASAPSAAPSAEIDSACPGVRTRARAPLPSRGSRHGVTPPSQGLATSPSEAGVAALSGCAHALAVATGCLKMLPSCGSCSCPAACGEGGGASSGAGGGRLRCTAWLAGGNTSGGAGSSGAGGSGAASV